MMNDTKRAPLNADVIAHARASSATKADPIDRLARRTSIAIPTSIITLSPVKAMTGPKDSACPPARIEPMALMIAYTLAPISSVPFTPRTSGSRCQNPIVKRLL